MGLRAASVRHPDAGVMAPALTETNQSQNFNLSPTSSLDPVTTKCGLFINKNDEPHTFETFDDYLLNKTNCKRTEASDSGLSSNDYNIMSNSPPSMGDQLLDTANMGLEKNSATFFKDKTLPNNDMEQMLSNFTSAVPTNELGNETVDDLMQVMKSIGGVPSDSESVFPLSTTDLSQNLAFERDFLNDVDVIGMCDDEPLSSTPVSKETQAKETLVELRRKQTKLERRTDFLMRRLRKIQARAMGQHVGGEVAGLFEQMYRLNNRPSDSAVDPMTSESFVLSPPVELINPIPSSSIKKFVKDLGRTTGSQSSIARQRQTLRYFGSGSFEQNSASRTLVDEVCLPSLPVQSKNELARVSGLLHSEMSMVDAQFDSDATASSSGGESCDEALNYNNVTQQYLSINKRAVWRYSHDRGAIVARWTWLQAQISDLEYKIRQHNDLHRQIRQCKGSVALGGTSPVHETPASPSAVNGYRGQLPGAAAPSANVKPIGSSGIVNFSEDTEGGAESAPQYCTRTRPLLKTFRKRKLLQTNGLHGISKKAARPSTMRCGCVPPIVPCALCTGRTDPTFPRDPMELLTKADRIALLDPGFHPVLSFTEDVSASIHLEAVMKVPEWQQKSMRCTVKPLKNNLNKNDRSEKTSGPEHGNKKTENRRKYTRILKANNNTNFSNKIKSKIISRGRKNSRHNTHLRFSKKRHPSKVAMAQFNTLTAEGADDEMEAISVANSTPISRSGSPATSPLLTMQSYRKNRINSYDIDNIVIPYSVAASTRVEKLQYKEILTPKWRVVDTEISVKYDPKNNGIVRKTSQDGETDTEDVSEDATLIRHEKSEHDEKKKFLSYLKFPLGISSRQRANRRTDSRAESSGANTPDPMSPHTGENAISESGGSPITSPPATPMAPNVNVTDDGIPSSSSSSTALQTLPLSNLRRRTISQSRWAKDRELKDENRSNTPEHIEVLPYDTRIFPLDDDAYDKMLRHMPEGHPLPSYLKPNCSLADETGLLPLYLEEKVGSPASDSTESAIADEDPNDPEWMDVERMHRSGDRAKR